MKTLIGICHVGWALLGSLTSWVAAEAVDLFGLCVARRSTDPKRCDHPYRRAASQHPDGRLEWWCPDCREEWFE